MMSQQDGEPFQPDLIRGVSPYGSKDTFQAGTLELNTLGRDNVDEEIQRHGNAAHFAAANERQNAGQTSNTRSLGGSSGSSSFHQSSSSFSSGGGATGGAGGAVTGSQLSGHKSSSNAFQSKNLK